MRAIILATFCLVTLACEVYVDYDSGNDVDGCGSQDNPCRQIGNNSSVCVASIHGIRLTLIPIQIWVWRRSSTVREVGVEGSDTSITDSSFYATTLNIISTSEDLPGHTIIHDNEIYSSQITLTVSSSSGIQSCGISRNYLNISSLGFSLEQETPGRQKLSVRNNTGHWYSFIKQPHDIDMSIVQNHMSTFDATVAGCVDGETYSSYKAKANHFGTLRFADCTAQCEFLVEDNDLRNTVLSFETLSTDRRSSLGGMAVVRQNRMVQGGDTSAISIGNGRTKRIEVSNNTITGYSAASGAGINMFNIMASEIVVSHNRIEGCSASTGAALSIVSAESNVTIEYNNMTQNVATLSCGAVGVWGYNKRVILRNCTMDRNRAPQTSAFYVTSADSIEVTNNTIRVDAVNSINDGHTIAMSGQPISLYNEVYCPSQMRLGLTTESSISSWACSPCQDGSYLLEAGVLRQGQTNHTRCLPCGDHLTCSSGRLPMAEGGYWCGKSLSEDNSLLCFDCPSDYCNRSRHEWNKSCANGRAGVLCGQYRCRPSMTALVILSPLLYVVLLTFLPIGDGSVWKSASFFIQTFPLLRLITSCLLVYSGVTSICLKILFCVQKVQIETEEKSGWVMYNAGSIECSGTWRKVLVAVAAVTLLPSPFFILYFRRKLKGRKTQTSRDMLMVLDGCYRNGCKYWETIYMLRKLVIAIIYVLGSYYDWTLSVMRTIIITSLTSHLMLRPFKTEAGQALETVCLLSLTLLSTLDTTEQKSWTIYVEVFLVVIPVLFSLLLAGRKLAVKFMRWLRKRQRNKTERARLLQTEDE
ncbi:hypothetical protein PROFUN_14086 [Planoprotostelium fungivorum]|uniref:Right handed beta helix domain-containing protein n=1 Tax=Planoprotostelium fungivorum TaxID=1890364 RepID=A0A2P6N208_9EUKA|nr:hypothetical protein PROFUN_14086 [Planoprotostelium fungivorum]